MLRTLQGLNSRLEALAFEVSGLRAIVNIQCRQLAALRAHGEVAQPGRALVFPRRRAVLNARGNRRIS